MPTMTEERTDLEVLLLEDAACEFEHIGSECWLTASHIIRCACAKDQVLACAAGAAEARTWINGRRFVCDICEEPVAECWTVRAA